MKKVVKDRYDSSPSDPFGDLEELGALLASIDWMLETRGTISERGGPDELLAPSMSMAKYLLLELVRSKKDEVRSTVEELGDDIKFVEPILRECEQELGLHPNVESNTFRERLDALRLDALKRQRESYNT